MLDYQFNNNNKLLFFIFLDKPNATLDLSWPRGKDHFREGESVFLECNVDANPRAHNVTWYHDVSKQLLYFLEYKQYDIK